MKKSLFLLVSAAIVASCSSDDTMQTTNGGVKPSAADLSQLTFGSVETRAHWVDGGDKQPLAFAWDADEVGTELVCAISDGTGYLPNYLVNGNAVGDAQYASYLTIAPDAENSKKATFTTVNSFENGLTLAGKTIHTVTPVTNITGNTATAFSATLAMPAEFTQEASADASFLRDYMYMYADVTVAEGEALLPFKHIPATLRFNIVNSGSTAITVKSVTIDAVEHSNGVLAAPLASSSVEASAAADAASLSLAYSAENTLSAVTTKLGADGASIEAGSSYVAYALVLPLGTDAALKDADLRIRVTTSEGTFTLFTLSGEQFNTATESYDWQSGNPYGFTLTVPELAETYQLPSGDTFEGTWSSVLGTCTKVRFVAGSSKNSDNVFHTDDNGVSGYWIVNGDWLELHTPAKQMVTAKSGQDMFQHKSTITAIDFGCNFNTESMTSMYRMFRNCSSLTVLDLSGFNTAKVTGMHIAFSGCTNLATLILGDNFTTANVTKTATMFADCSSLVSLDLSNFNTAKVTDMNGMFNNCSSLATLNLGENFTTANVTNMGNMFNGCAALTSLDVTGFDTEKVTYMTQMFNGCAALTSLDLSSFNTSAVTSDMNNMFNGCAALTTLTLGDNFKTDGVTGMSNMFNGCSALTSLDLSNFNTANVTAMSAMFSSCSALTSLDLSSFNTSAVASDMNNMFNGCSKLATLTLGENFSTTNVTGMASMFYGCSKLTSFDFLSKFNTENVTRMDQMFRNCNFGSIEIDLTNFNTSNVTTMERMFQDVNNPTSIDLSSFDFSNVTKTYVMFRKATKVYVTRDGYEHLNSESVSHKVGTDILYDKNTGSLWSDIIAAEGESSEATE